MPSFQEKPIGLASVIVTGGVIDAANTRTTGCVVTRESLGTYNIDLNESAGTSEVSAYVGVLAAPGGGTFPLWKVVGYPASTNPTPYTRVRIQFVLDGVLADPLGFSARVDRVAIGQAP